MIYEQSEIQMTSCFVLEQMTQAGSSLLAAQCVFPSDTCIARGRRDATVPDSPSHPSQSALAGFGLAAQWRSCESTLHTYTQTKHTLGNKTHTHDSTEQRSVHS